MFSIESQCTHLICFSFNFKNQATNYTNDQNLKLTVNYRKILHYVIGIHNETAA